MTDADVKEEDVVDFIKSLPANNAGKAGAFIMGTASAKRNILTELKDSVTMIKTARNQTKAKPRIINLIFLCAGILLVLLTQLLSRF